MPSSPIAATRGAVSRRRSARGPDALLGYLIPLVIIGLSIADFVRDGQVDKYLIGALMIFGLGALGYRIDTLIEKYLDARAGRIPPRETPPDA
jgi:hypothetical protein